MIITNEKLLEIAQAVNIGCYCGFAGQVCCSTCIKISIILEDKLEKLGITVGYSEGAEWKESTKEERSKT